MSVKLKPTVQKVEKELSGVCNDILNVLDQHLIPSAQAGESKVLLSQNVRKLSYLPYV